MAYDIDRGDRTWREDGERHGWQLPKKAAWPLRLPVIRDVRGHWHAWQVHRMAGQLASVGIGFGGPNQFDLWVLYAIFRGWC